MRSLLALSGVLLFVNNAAQEPEYASLIANYLQQPDGSIQEFAEQSVGRGDRLPLAFALRPTAQSVARADDDTAVSLPPLSIVSEPPRRLMVLASADPDAGLHREPDSADFAIDPTAEQGHSAMDDLCNTLLTSAQENDIPVQFFANLLWQESGLRNDIVSHKGAQGIAQFMPEVARENGLADPFDPMQAIPASARLLRSLKAQFSNLGYAAAAYNAGPHRVAQWLLHRKKLPRETQNYVTTITGKTAEQWRNAPPDESNLKFFRRLPCRMMPAFAALEQQQRELQQQTATDESPAAANSLTLEEAPARSHIRPHANNHIATHSIRHGGKRPLGVPQHQVDHHRPGAKHVASAE